jgi:hypothetical protein
MQQLFYGIIYLMILEKFPILISLRIFKNILKSWNGNFYHIDDVSIYDVTTIACATSDDISIYDITTIACATSDDVSIYDVTTIACATSDDISIYDVTTK